jgi:hypothetical protein
MEILHPASRTAWKQVAGNYPEFRRFQFDARIEGELRLCAGLLGAASSYRRRTARMTTHDLALADPGLR